MRKRQGRCAMGKWIRGTGSVKEDNRLLAVTAALCFLAGLLFSQEDAHDMTAAGYVFLLALAAGCNVAARLGRREERSQRRILLCSLMGVFFLGLLKVTYWLRGSGELKERALIPVTVVFGVLLVLWGAFCIRREGGITENLILLLIFGSFLAKLFFAVTTQGHIIQNDGGNLNLDDTGHLGYVFTVLVTHRLPGNPMEKLQFYQPPLHYVISALTLRVYAALGVEFSCWDEILQLPPVFYSTAMLVVLNKIGVKIKCPVSGRLLAVGLAAFFPYSLYMSGANNNDPLMTLLVLMCVYATLLWYEKPTLKGILFMAVCIGCAMMTKISAALIAPAMAVVMLRRAWRDRGGWKRYVKQFACFGLAAFPLGLWYSVYCRIRYGMPFGYVYRISEETSQFLGRDLKWERFQGWAEALGRVNIAFGWDGETPEANIPVTLIKYGVFNELQSFDSNGVLFFLARGALWGTIALAALVIVSFAAWLFFREYSLAHKALLGLGAAVIMGAYVLFCYQYPYVCSMNIRYVMSAVYLGFLALGCTVSSLSERMKRRWGRPGRIVTAAAGAAAAAYMVCCALMIYNLELLLF